MSTIEIIELKKCPVCETEYWKDLDYLRDKKYWENQGTIYDYPFNFKICMNCGFVTYDYLPENLIQKKYEMQRQKITIGNIIIGNRKNEYHKAFLKDILEQLYHKEGDNIKIVDIGGAQGQFLDWVAKYLMTPRSNLYLTEYCEKFLAFAKYEYGLNVAKDIVDFAEQFD